MRRFKLVRRATIHDGADAAPPEPRQVHAEGIEWTDGSVALRWGTGLTGADFWTSIDGLSEFFRSSHEIVFLHDDEAMGIFRDLACVAPLLPNGDCGFCAVLVGEDTPHEASCVWWRAVQILQDRNALPREEDAEPLEPVKYSDWGG